MASIFQTHTTQNIPIFLVDASGSVRINFNTNTVFDTIKNIVIGLKCEKIHVLFWNSDAPAKPFFANGIYRIPFVVNRDAINGTFRHVQQNITDNCLTMPHLAFNNIPADWINDKDLTKIYYITDGQIGYNMITPYELRNLKEQLSTSIRRLFEKHNNIQLNIITVEPKTVDLSVRESTTNAAGCDVYNIIMQERLTNYITKFVSHTLNNPNGFVHINKNIPPAGHLPYNDTFFSILKINEFIEYIMHEVDAVRDDEDKLLQIIQNLSATLAALTKNKHHSVIDGTINTFCNIFKDTKIDQMFARFILTEAIQRENTGTAEIYSAYRAQLKDLFRRADELLTENVKTALNINNKFITMPMHNKIITGSHRMVDKNIISRKTYRNAAVEIGKHLVPVLPCEPVNSVMTEQCIRQWVRLIISRVERIDVQEDLIMYIVLGNILRVVMSDVPESVKDTFRSIGHIMLRKKRLSKDTTELSILEAGDIPTDNMGKETSFFNFMNEVSRRLNIKLDPFVLWYAMCLALNNENMRIKQLIHCSDAIKKEYGDIDPHNLLNILKPLNVIPNVNIIDIPVDATLDYTCLITMEDTSATGGFKFQPHQTRFGVTCCPQNVLSTTGYTQLLAAGEACICPLCYMKLNETNFAHVDAKPPQQDMSTIFADTDLNIFGSTPISVQRAIIEPTPTFAPGTAASAVACSASQPETPGTVVLLSGTVGAGKSHFARLLCDYIHQHDGVAIIEGTDKYCKSGIQTRDAIGMVADNLRGFKSRVTDKHKYIIIDTCGESNAGTRFFNVDFSNWKIQKYSPNLIREQMDGYLHWSLRNVLRRGVPDASSTHYLNPVSAPLKVCVQVHTKKAKALFGQQTNTPVHWNLSTVDDTISKLNEKADAYEHLLAETLPINVEVEKLFTVMN